MGGTSFGSSARPSLALCVGLHWIALSLDWIHQLSTAWIITSSNRYRRSLGLSFADSPPTIEPRTTAATRCSPTDDTTPATQLYQHPRVILSFSTTTTTSCAYLARVLFRQTQNRSHLTITDLTWIWPSEQSFGLCYVVIHTTTQLCRPRLYSAPFFDPIGTELLDTRYHQHVSPPPQRPNARRSLSAGCVVACGYRYRS